MKVLFITPYITAIDYPAFQRNQTGFGYMVHDIAQYVAKKEKVDLFIAMTFSSNMEVDGFRVIGRSIWSFLRNLKLKCLLDGLSFLSKYPLSFKNSLRTLYVFLSIGQVEKILKDYDLVHIHGCSVLTDAVIKSCKRRKVPFLVTLHGLNSFEKSIKLNESLCSYEKAFLMESVTNHYPVSFISSGNKRTAEEFTNKRSNKYSVICNGCNVERKSIVQDIRKHYNISADDYVFVFVGNVSVNKNQLQVARAWELLNDDLKEKCKVLFVGRYNENDELVKYIRNKNLESNLILCGLQAKEKVSDFYHASDATILTSITEGFGLSIIEGFVYGKPNVTFADLPAVNDLYDQQVMILAEERNDEALADAMVRIMKTTFNQDTIISHSTNFSFEKMAMKYITLYKEIINYNQVRKI